MSDATVQDAASKGETHPALPQDALIILPVRQTVLFPGIMLPLAIGRPSSIAAAQEAVRAERMLGVLLQTDPAVEEPKPEHLHKVGTVARILRYVTSHDGTHHVICQGVRRFRVVEFILGFPFLAARVEEIAAAEVLTPEVEARVNLLRERAREAIQLLPSVPPEVAAAIDQLDSASALVDFIAGISDVPPAEKQAVLETSDVKERLDKVLALLAHRIEVLKLTKQIGEQTQQSLSSQQREHILREQLRHIQKELGEGDEKSAEIADLREQIEKAGMPKEAEDQARKELKRLERMPEASPEYGMIRTYLDWLIELPWSKLSPDSIDVAEARRILDEDHYGLPKVKRRILEYLAVRKLNPEGKSPILCFVGPPGVGKTSLGQSIARAMNRKFVRQSLGGVHDEADIRGHRRTYIGALPGNIIQGIRKAGTNNPVFMLDEIDKLGASFHGDPSAALLEVLDPAQNTSFQDLYLGVDFDLSRVMFIATANVLDTIPAPLRDRMEILQLPGYIEEDKVAIATQYLIPRQISENGLSDGQISFSSDAIREIIQGYTREAGVRQLEREIGTICRGVATRVAEGHKEVIFIERDSVRAYLGPAKFFNEIALRTSMPGVATGLAWTPVGGDILFIEATKMAGDGKLQLTGQLGDVMKESAQAAMSLVKSRAESLGIAPEQFRNQDIHVHIPAGAIPKDGPSAGVTLFVALVSLLLGKRVRKDLAMTGEISLRGLVLPVGGIKEKVLAAKRAGIACVLLPAMNRRDLEEIPPSALEGIRFEFLTTVDEALEHALEPETDEPFQSCAAEIQANAS